MIDKMISIKPHMSEIVVGNLQWKQWIETNGI